jgi:threonine dehydrogenase-like Zn-dependent dehydrogenase
MPSMRAALVGGPGEIGAGARERPEPGAGEVRVRVEACGVCGSDLHLFHGRMMAEGHTPGHEIAGRVDAVSDGVDGLAPGLHVCVEPLHTCGSCRSCREGRDSTCRQCQVFGVHRPGGFAEYVVVPARRLFELPDDLPPVLSALAEPMAVSVHGVHRGAFERGQRVLVLGAGNVGLVSLVAARAMGAGEVLISARHAHQAELARELGADRVLDEKEATPEALGALGLERDIDLVIETVGGTANTLRAACHAIRPGGVVSVVGLFLQDPGLEPLPLFLKEGTLAWSNCYHRGPGAPDFDEAVRILDAERDALARLLTHSVPLTEIDRAFRLASDKKAGVIKVSVIP